MVRTWPDFYADLVPLRVYFSKVSPSRQLVCQKMTSHYFSLMTLTILLLELFLFVKWTDKPLTKIFEERNEISYYFIWKHCWNILCVMRKKYRENWVSLYVSVFNFFFLEISQINLNTVFTIESRKWFAIYMFNLFYVQSWIENMKNAWFDFFEICHGWYSTK